MVEQDRMFVGRDKPLSLLKNAMDEVASSNGGSFLISGPPGIGKTYLANKVMDEARSRGWTVLKSECQFGETSDPYFPIVRAIQDHIQRSHEAEGEYRSTLPHEQASTSLPVGLMGVDTDGDPQVDEVKPGARITAQFSYERDWMFENVSTYIEGLTKKAPVLFFLDDLQWAEKATLQIFHYMVRNLKNSKVLLLAAYRPEVIEAMGPHHPMNDLKPRLEREGLVTDLKLQRFRTDDTCKLVEALTGCAVPMDMVKRIQEETEGNPYFIREFVSTLMDREILVKGEGVKGEPDLEALTIPPSVTDFIMSRVDALKENERKILEYGAVIGLEFPYDILLGSCGLEEDETVDALDKLIGLKIITEREEEGFVHYRPTNKLIREAVYDSLSRARRRIIHRKVGAAIEKYRGSQGDVYALAYHFHMAGTIEKGLEYSIKAGETAMARLAFDESSRYFATALDLLGKLEDSEEVISREITILLRTAETSMVLGEWRTALRYFYDAIRLCKSDNKEKAMAHLGIGYIETKRTEWKLAKSSFKEALRISEAIDDKWGIADSLIGFARINWRLGDHDKTIEYTNRAIEAAKSINYRRLIAQANMDIAGSYAIIKGDNDKAMEYLKIAQDTLDMKKDLDLLIKVTNNMGDLYMKFGKYEKAMECFDKELDMAERSGVLIYKAFGNLSHGECLIYMGQYEEALPFIQKSQRFFEKMDDRTMISMTFTLEGVIAREMGGYKEAEAQFGMALKIQEEKKLKWGLAKTLFEYGLLKKATADGAQARKYLQRALEQYKELGSDPKIQEIEEELKALDE